MKETLVIYFTVIPQNSSRELEAGQEKSQSV
jgi:hypothetical protein